MYYFDQTDLPLPLASRFDIIWFLRDEINIISDEKIASHILDVRTEGISETELESGFSFDPFDEDDEIIQVDVNNKEHFSNSFLRKYIAYAKLNIHPQLDKNAKSLILDYYTQERQKFRQDSAFNPNTPGTGRPEADAKVIPITPRSLEALIRISEAHARMNLRDTATSEDAKVAIAVYQHWREESNIEDESALFSSVPTVERTSPRVVREIVRDICSERTVAKLHEIYSRASVHKITERMVDEALSKMRMNGELFSPRNDEYSFAR
jgi:replicative DNA helicase Mcm